MRRAVRGLLLSLSALAGLGGCAVGRPMRGPGPGGVTGDLVVVVTHVRIDDEARDAFFDYVLGLEKTLRDGDYPGFVGLSLRVELLGDEAWTLSAWRSEAEMMAFVHSEAHLDAMTDGLMTVDDSRFARFTVPAETYPIAWRTALAELEKQPPLE